MVNSRQANRQAVSNPITADSNPMTAGSRQADRQAGNVSIYITYAGARADRMVEIATTFTKLIIVYVGLPKINSHK
jgi:hypothetical protein